MPYTTHFIKYPIFNTILYTCMPLFILFIGGIIWGLYSVPVIIIKTILTTMLLGVLIHAKIFTAINNWTFTTRQRLAILVFIAYMIPVIIISGFRAYDTLPMVILFNLCTGFFEEFLFRGILFIGLITAFYQHSKHPVYKAIILSSFIFGGIHIFNIWGGLYIWQSIFQSVGAIIMGMAFAMLIIIIRNIWIVAILHGLHNALPLNSTYWFLSGNHMDLIIMASVLCGFMGVLYRKSDSIQFIQHIQHQK